MRKNFIKVKTQREAMHCWLDAPDTVSFLRNLHRHIFFIEVTLEVAELDRQLEFFMVQEDLKSIVELSIPKVSKYSCEMMANDIMNRLENTYPVVRVEVSEDGENSAFVTND